jgi:hypothetical protein
VIHHFYHEPNATSYGDSCPTAFIGLPFSVSHRMGP